MKKIAMAAALFLAACNGVEDAAEDTAKTADENTAASDEQTAANDEGEAKPSPAEVIAASTVDDWMTLDPENLLYIELERGTVIVALSSELAQNHTAQMRSLAREGFYDGLSFYRVIDGFVAQGGDLLETREVKTAEASLAAEFDQPLSADITFTPIRDADGYAEKVGFVGSSPAGVKDGRIWHLHCTGAMAMARGNEPDTGGTEFYITLQNQRYLDRNLTVFGRVIQGMEHVQAIRRVAPAESEDGDLGEKILSVKLGADIPETERETLEILRSDTDTFQAYVESRRNRPEAFFFYRPDYIDVCALSVPVRVKTAAAE